jgi:Leucine-rich repeat (LRR) protein
MPTFPKLDKELILKFARVEALEGTFNMVGSQRSIEFPPLSMLKFLKIGGYDLNVKKLPKDWVRNLTSLKYLGFYKLPDKKFQDIEIFFKDDFNYLPFLENITFMDCKDLKALPDWICNLSSLQHIKLLDCECLVSLPEGMPSLAKLQTLQIIGCPGLMEECATQTSATWPKIAHIPNIILKPY